MVGNADSPERHLLDVAALLLRINRAIASVACRLGGRLGVTGTRAGLRACGAIAPAERASAGRRARGEGGGEDFVAASAGRLVPRLHIQPRQDFLYGHL